MDSFNWSNQEQEESILYGRNKLNQIIISKDGFNNSVQQIPKNDHVYPNVISQWEVAINRPASTLNNNPQNGLLLDQKMKSKVLSTNTTSLDSLDCLLSASNSHTTDTNNSFEDDGISVIFSDCEKLWNFDTDPTAKYMPSASIMANNELNCTKKRKSENKANNFHQSNIAENEAKPKKPRLENRPMMTSLNINFQQPSSSTTSSSVDEPDSEAIAHMKEMIYRAAAFRPVNFGEEKLEKPKRKNVKISSDPQTVAARQRRERISERIRVLQSLVPGGSKMDTASMLDEAANYLKFLRSQVKALEAIGQKIDTVNYNLPNSNLPFSPFVNYSFTMQ
ncbi:hypothetical protein ACJIZ3_020451 [Penstemon smallii]|uniref:BHLH domain-containing protein n=1 Tax=Penstemon smallii TaxID=265156 RepID=A0ABD3SJD9_9LAMI